MYVDVKPLPGAKALYFVGIAGRKFVVGITGSLIAAPEPEKSLIIRSTRNCDRSQSLGVIEVRSPGGCKQGKISVKTFPLST